ncbi:glycoside hydrolase family 97 catalytic domain-containing protein [Pedobacter heparinus]|uniref:glycoside hydrolase family 97 protein n=1 Tax=Pedobacter heparinus TaxID=984 RepID=UPI0039777645
MRSPSGNLSAKIYHKNGKLFYKIAAGEKVLINNGSMGLIVDGIAYGTQVKDISSLKKSTIQSKSKTYNSYHILITEAGRKYRVEFMLSNEGTAFRYIFDGKTDQLVSRELTTFILPASRVWFFERNSSWKLKSYAGLWQSTSADSLDVVSSQGPIQGKPLLFELPGKKYAMLTEAALYNYSGMRFRAMGKRTLQADFTEKDGFKVTGKIITPWRVLLYASGLNGLVNNTMINDLNPEPDKALYADKSYIKPGRAVWSWITRTDNYMQPEEEMKFINAAAELNFEYTMLDEGWETVWPDKWKQLIAICNFAASKKVGVWVWKNSKALRDPLTRDAFLDSVRNAGVVGIKTDFMDSEAKELIDFEIGFLKACAKRKLMVNFHGCHAPTGESKTYPNEMTREGIRGMELNIMKEPIPAWHNAALPFTRLILGHGDYTPGLFYNKANTSYTHQLALFYLFNSPFQCLAENPVKLLADEKFKPVIPLLKTLPVTWDETIVLPGSSVGEIAAIAKRKGEVWYVAVINGTAKNREFSLHPSFLKTAKKYTMVTITDAADGFLKETATLVAADDKKIVIGPNGGLLIEIKP